MEQFLLAEGFIGGMAVEIDEDRFNEILHAKNVIKPIWDVEDTFTLLANAFIEFEESLISVGLRYLFEKDMQRDVDHFFDDARVRIHNQYMTVAASAMADRKTLGQRS